jgi:hypothetical protein
MASIFEAIFFCAGVFSYRGRPSLCGICARFR